MVDPSSCEEGFFGSSKGKFKKSRKIEVLLFEPEFILLAVLKLNGFWHPVDWSRVERSSEIHSHFLRALSIRG
jgi:hypothetical protein